MKSFKTTVKIKVFIFLVRQVFIQTCNFYSQPNHLFMVANDNVGTSWVPQCLLLLLLFFFCQEEVTKIAAARAKQSRRKATRQDKTKLVFRVFRPAFGCLPSRFLAKGKKIKAFIFLQV